MSFEAFLFYVFAAVLVFAALRVVTSRNPVHAAMYLVLAFFTSAAVWLLLEAEFLAIALVLVYVGAVMVLFLFVVMMLDINVAELRGSFGRALPLGLTVAGVIVTEIVLVVTGRHFGMSAYPLPPGLAEGESNTEALGMVMYTVYVYPFELASVVLLVAIIAAITLTFRRREGVRYQDPAEQVRVRSTERVRMVKGMGSAGEGEPGNRGG